MYIFVAFSMILENISTILVINNSYDIKYFTDNYLVFFIIYLPINIISNLYK
jgi:hypothetical protein